MVRSLRDWRKVRPIVRMVIYYMFTDVLWHFLNLCIWIIRRRNKLNLSTSTCRIPGKTGRISGEIEKGWIEVLCLHLISLHVNDPSFQHVHRSQNKYANKAWGKMQVEGCLLGGIQSRLVLWFNWSNRMKLSKVMKTELKACCSTQFTSWVIHSVPNSKEP